MDKLLFQRKRKAGIILVSFEYYMFAAHRNADAPEPAGLAWIHAVDTLAARRGDLAMELESRAESSVKYARNS